MRGICTLKFCSYHDNHLEKIKCPLFFPGDEHYLKFLFCVCISLCSDGIGLSSYKDNAITFCYTPEIHEFLVKIKGGNLKIFHCGGILIESKLHCNFIAKADTPEISYREL